MLVMLQSAESEQISHCPDPKRSRCDQLIPLTGCVPTETVYAGDKHQCPHASVVSLEDKVYQRRPASGSSRLFAQFSLRPSRYTGLGWTQNQEWGGGLLILDRGCVEVNGPNSKKGVLRRNFF